MAVASLLAGALPLSLALSQSQLRLISTVGMGVLVGTSLVVIIPEGIETLYTARSVSRSHEHRGSAGKTLDIRWAQMKEHSSTWEDLPWLRDIEGERKRGSDDLKPWRDPSATRNQLEGARGESPLENSGSSKNRDSPAESNVEKESSRTDKDRSENHSPHAFVGISLLLGFLLMYLIDKIPQHASNSSQAYHQPQHISLENFAQGLHRIESRGEDLTDGNFDLHPHPQHNRHLSTTTGLVIHAAADGVALGASSSTANTSLSFIIFIAIMIHKAPAAFGLTSILLKQGLSKRAARAHLVIFSLAAPVGALVTWCLVSLAGRGRFGMEEDTQRFTGILLLFSAGTFLYVAMHTMQEDGHSAPPDPSDGYMNGGARPRRPKKGPRLSDTLAAVVGMLIPLLTQYGHHH
ncbi:MAG: hypothetical protein M1816_003480 [Peltula sp. TS41687]|nr:MAG: hypothetical protein M1816_003480 [Peltula sp. TS41687]